MNNKNVFRLGFCTCLVGGFLWVTAGAMVPATEYHPPVVDLDSVLPTLVNLDHVHHYVYSTNRLGEYPLHVALKKKLFNIVWVLLSTPQPQLGMRTFNSETVLHYAAKYGDLKMVTLFLAYGLNANAVSLDGKTPLHYAAEDGLASIGNKLIQCGAAVNAVDLQGNSSLHYAVLHKNKKMMKVLLGAKAHVDVQNNDGETPLHIAVLQDSLDAVRMLLAADAQLYLRNKKGETPLDYARSIGYKKYEALFDSYIFTNSMRSNRPSDKVKAQVQASKNAEIMPQDQHFNANSDHTLASLDVGVSGSEQTSGMTTNDISLTRQLSGALPQRASATSLTLQFVEKYINDYELQQSNQLFDAIRLHDNVLLSNRIKLDNAINMVTPFKKISLLHLAVMNRNPEACALLLDGGASVNVKMYNGATPLHIAAENNDDACLLLLLKAGADANIAQQDGKTALHIAVAHQHSVCVKHLVYFGAFIHAVDATGITPMQLVLSVNNTMILNMLCFGENDGAQQRDHFPALHKAVINNDLEKVRVLLQQGANPNAYDANKTTALHYAARLGHVDVMTLLFQHGALSNLREGRYQATPLHYAVQCGNDQMLRLLLEYKADVNAIDSFLGSTPLHTAVSNKRLSTVKLLLKAGAVVDLKNYDNYTPRELAEALDLYDFVEAIRLYQRGVVDL